MRRRKVEKEEEMRRRVPNEFFKVVEQSSMDLSMSARRDEENEVDTSSPPVPGLPRKSPMEILSSLAKVRLGSLQPLHKDLTSVPGGPPWKELPIIRRTVFPARLGLSPPATP